MISSRAAPQVAIDRCQVLLCCWEIGTPSVSRNDAKTAYSAQVLAIVTHCGLGTQEPLEDLGRKDHAAIDTGETVLAARPGSCSPLSAIQTWAASLHAKASGGQARPLCGEARSAGDDPCCHGKPWNAPLSSGPKCLPNRPLLDSFSGMFRPAVPCKPENLRKLAQVIRLMERRLRVHFDRRAAATI